MSDPSIDGPTEEEMRAYLESLRNAQPVEIVVQAFGILATASEVKLGMPDARVLIDGMAGLLDATSANMPEQIVERMRQTVAQLQMAQVQAEGEAGQPSDPDGTAGDGSGAGAESAGQDTASPRQAPRQPEQPQRQPEQPQRQQGSDAASRLWIPGRD